MSTHPEKMKTALIYQAIPSGEVSFQNMIFDPSGKGTLKT
jgi:hypothetical protein